MYETTLYTGRYTQEALAREETCYYTIPSRRPLEEIREQKDLGNVFI